MQRSDTYTVKRGDNLSKIAKEHSVRNWQLLYYSPANKSFRQQHPNPDSIRPGAVLNIPKNPHAEEARLRKQLGELRIQRQQIISFIEMEKRKLRSTTRTVNAAGATVDALANVAMVFVGLGSLLKQGFAWNAASGVAKKKLQDEIVRGTVTGIAKKTGDAAAIVISSDAVGASGTTMLTIKAAAQAWCDITSPSFWANTVSQLPVDPTSPNTWTAGNFEKMNWSSWSKAVATKPEDVNQQAIEKLDRYSKSFGSRLDNSIRDIEKALI